MFEGDQRVDVDSSIDGAPLGSYENLSEAGLDSLLGQASKSFSEMRSVRETERAGVLKDLAAAVRNESDRLADLLCRETSKPISLAKQELKTAAGIFMTGASEAVRNRNIIEPLFVPLGSLQRMNMIRRFPRGPVLSTIPPSSPISLAAHQIAAALAAGAPLILRPSSRAALTTMALADALYEKLEGRAWFSVAPMTYEVFEKALADDRIAMLSFFGKSSNADALRAVACRKRAAVHVGGGATAIVSHDADVKYAISCIVKGAFANAGRSGNTIELVLVHERIYPQFRERFSSAVEVDAVMGDPLDEKTLCGPLFTEEDAVRLEEWLAAAIKAGGRVVMGGERTGRFIKPAVVEDLPLKFISENPRALGPICSMLPVSDLREAVNIIEAVGQDFISALFSREQAEGLFLLSNLRVGTVIMNEYPLDIEEGLMYRSSRAGGGGLYGVRFAVDEMTEPRDMLFNNYWGG